jgi:NAD(P)-dependent dehydrogenase (short-subunit alcohol dehydrogenase family)
MNQVVLITGASSGTGLQTAKQLAAKGYKVFGTSRNPKPSQDLPFKMLAPDVNIPSGMSPGSFQCLGSF